MNNTRNILTALLAVLCMSACTEDILEVKDETLKAELEIITPVVGYGGCFEARLLCSCAEVVFT